MEYIFSVISPGHNLLYKHKLEDYDEVKVTRINMNESVHLPTALSPETSETLTASAYDTVEGQAEIPGAKKPIPYTTLLPRTLVSNNHAVIVNGYCAIKETSDALGAALAGNGVATTIYDPARVHSSRLDWLRHIANPQSLHYESLRGVTTHARQNIEYARYQNGSVIRDGKLILIGHSMGNLAMMDFGVKHPEELDMVISLAGVGLEEPLGLKLVWRTKDVVADVATNIVRGNFEGYGLRVAYRSLHYIGRNPVRTAAEAISCMVADKRKHGMKLAELGVHHEIICAEDDGYFYYQDTLKAMQGIASNCHVIEDMSHVGPQVQPHRTARYLGGIITSESIKPASA